MKVIFLGTNGGYSTETGNTESILIDSKNHYIVLDAGNGLYQLNKYISENKPILIFISHFHLDHIEGLHNLLLLKFPQGMDIYFAKGRKHDFENIIRPPYTVSIEENPENIRNLPLKIRIHEIEGKQNVQGLEVEILEMFHAYKDHGYRIVIEDKIIAYSGDSGICDNSQKLAQNADLLIHECASFEELTNDIWGHVNQTMAAKLAKETNVKTLILNHFGPKAFPTIEKRKEAEKMAQEIFPNTIAATDDLIIEI
jgi:ribonuclease BN (tRNA processing enzyme)